jgi:hypothetical protein
MKYPCIDAPVERARGRVGEEMGSTNDIWGMLTSVNWRRQAQNRGIAKAIKWVLSVTQQTRWDEKAGLQRDAICSQ